MLTRLFEQYRKFMYGRNGSDMLCVALLIVTFIIALLFSFVPAKFWFLRLICYIPLGLCVFRMLSRNQAKRQLENERFLIWWRNFYNSVKRQKQRIKDRKYYCFFRCPSCKQMLRLPKGRGKIRITCPKCSHVFEKKT